MENSRGCKEKRMGKFQGVCENFDRITGSGREKYWKIPGGGRKTNEKITGGSESFDGIPGGRRKKTLGNFRGEVGESLEFQGVQFLKKDILNRGYGTFPEKLN